MRAWTAAPNGGKLGRDKKAEMKRAAVVVLVAVFGVSVIAGYRVAATFGLFRRFAPRFAGTCRVVPGVVGAEDVTIDVPTRTAYLSADDRRAALQGKPVRGEIYALDLRDRTATPVPLTGGAPADFHPHGISLWQGPSGEKRLFAINHPTSGAHSVEIYRVQPAALVHLETIRYPELRSPNDVLAVGDLQFYATNDRRYASGIAAVAEALFQLPLASVSYFDGAKGRIVASNFAFANGINSSADGKEVYVAELFGRAVHIFGRDPASGALAWKRKIRLPSCPDNIERDEAGNLWVAAHAKLLDFLAHAKNPANPAPSQVFWVQPRTGRVQEVYADSGTAISAASTAAVADDAMVLGAVFDSKVLVCTRPVPSGHAS